METNAYFISKNTALGFVGLLGDSPAFEIAVAAFDPEKDIPVSGDGALQVGGNRFVVIPAFCYFKL